MEVARESGDPAVGVSFAVKERDEDGSGLRGIAKTTVAATLMALVLSGCADSGFLDPSSPSAKRVGDLGWILISVATVVTIGVFALLGYGLARRRHGEDESVGEDDLHPDERWAERWLLGGGVILPVVVLLPIAALSVSILIDDSSPELAVDVTGHQFWWEYRYPDSGVVTANELHIPVDRDVELTLRSDDVIHSFWVPQLGGKADLVPGHVNTMTLHADTPGRYDGVCAEFCGLQHAKMLFSVVAMTDDDFESWIAEQQTDAQARTDDHGAELFTTQGCASCHTVRGTEADGLLGPDLTHIASRDTLGAGVLENTPANMKRWIGETWEEVGS